MFGLICSGRPVAIAQQVDDLKFVFNVENGQNISHVSLFILPDTPFDPNYTALIYFQLPNSDPSPVISQAASSTPNFQLLGKLSIDKPSAIFKIKNSSNNTMNTASNTAQIDDDAMIDDDTAIGSTTNAANINPTDPSGTLIIGISIEPNLQAAQLLAEAKQQQQQQSQAKLLTSGNVPTDAGLTAGQLAAKDLQGTALLASKIVSNAYNYLSGFVDNNNKVSMKVLDGWWEKFKAKLQNDPKFLDN